MGTNFYLKRKLSKQEKDIAKELIDNDKYDEVRDILPNDVHIGKRSYGWKFLWNANDFKYFEPNIDSLMNFLKSGDIYNEYGDYFTFDQFIKEEVGERIDKGWDLAEYYKSDPTVVPYYIPSRDKIEYQKKHNITPNNYGEFNIDNYRFTIHTEFG